MTFFQDFVMGLSVVGRGTLHEKLQWAFSLYDINGDGKISREEMSDVLTAIYDMMGTYAQPKIYQHTITDHVEKVFKVSDHVKRKCFG